MLVLNHRDDERRTALMLAAGQGHTSVMKILMENHASINDSDKNKVNRQEKPTTCGTMAADVLEIYLFLGCEHNADPLNILMVHLQLL